ncbi:prolyl oligopeptidase family serine peptidase [Sporomusa acidovorans]|uniref:Dienelactone hydrolase domain-containing protein n=1 Tax=Sporomusa acidovorans (strain ATCC 49682 / DSM 3132 / Mol) TaxID=1123286 RepID=A0ABZ3J4Z2_SPOA4|nr:prolyl oligopeptidase family serine peptidase [Sporomusa acidovorans]OZC18255.1 alpha/beta hydrolase family protein [Sporomusa acidovorans DSM 3132]SDF25987.1 Alpha/beta hydrolase family protein [Sporomusa acidovorans]
MKKIAGIFIFLVIVALGYFRQNDYQVNEQKVTTIEPASALTPSTSETIEPSDGFVEKTSAFMYHDQKIQYLIIFPAGYTQTTNQWPMILFLHGGSLRGQDLELVKSYGPPWVAEQSANFPFVVLAPQCPEGEDWLEKSDILAALLDDVLRKYRIDQERVYLTGTSLGGNGTWYLACQHPEYFAAIAPLASNPVIPDNWNKGFLSMPVWAFHGEKDTVLPLKNHEAMISELRKQGGTPRFTVLPDQGHYIAGVYKNHELYDWFLANSRQH